MALNEEVPRTSREEAPSRWGRAGLALILVIAFFVITTVVWVKRDSVPPLWDQAQYLQESELLYHVLRQHGPVAFLSQFSETLRTKAPLITVLPLPFYFFLGEDQLSARYVNVVFIVLASWYLFRLGEMVAGRRAALLSVVILNTFPLVAGMSRQFLVEYGLMTLVILWMYYLVRWQRGEERGSSWALGLLLGLGMLLKVTFPLYVGVPTALMFAQELRKRRPRAAVLGSLARIAVIAVPIAGTWYFKNWASVFAFVVQGGFGHEAREYSKGDLFSLPTLSAYWLDLINFGMGGYALVLLVVLACWVGVGLRRGENRSGVAGAHLPLLLAWWVVPWLALTFAVNKDIRYSVPYLPALALLLGAGWEGLTRRRFGIAGLGLIAAVSILNYGYYSFGSPRPAGGELRAAGLILLSQNLMWAHPPTPETWPNESVVRWIATDAAKRGIAQPHVTVLFSHARLSAHNLNYLAALRELPIQFSTWHFRSPEPSSELASRVRTQADYLLTKSGFMGGNLLNITNLEVLHLLQEEGMPFDRIGSIALPDQSDVIVFRRQGPR